MPKTQFRQERRIWWSVLSKAAERSNKRTTEMLSLSRAERMWFTVCNKMVSVQVSCSVGGLKRIAEVVFLEMGEN